MFRQWQDCRNALLARITACAASLILVLTVATVLCSARIASATPVIVTEQGPLTGVAAAGENQYQASPMPPPDGKPALAAATTSGAIKRDLSSNSGG
jgi:hypothetical protein